MLRIEAACADSVILYFPACPDQGLCRHITDSCRLLRELPEVVDLVPAAGSVLLTFDLLQTDSARLRHRLTTLLSPLLTENDCQTAEPSAPARPQIRPEAGHKGFTVLHPGLMSQLQDAGHTGRQREGQAPGGPMDEHAFLWANHLLENPWHAPVVEVSFGGLKLQAQVDTLIAVTGADLALTLNDSPVASWEIIPVRAGDRLEIGYPRTGTRAYLAVKGGFQPESQRAGLSVATVQRQQLGGLHGDGRALDFGDCLACDEQEHRKDARLQGMIGKRVGNRYLPDYSGPAELRVVAGFQYDRLPAEQLERFFNQSYRISTDSDRISIVLAGDAITPLEPRIRDEGVSLGAIQLTDDGQIRIAMHDRELTGPFPKIGSVYPPDLGQLAQRQPKTDVRFRLMPRYEAEQDLMRFYRYFRKA